VQSIVASHRQTPGFALATLSIPPSGLASNQVAAHGRRDAPTGAALEGGGRGCRGTIDVGAVARGDLGELGT
jgi:hypothetical protein